MNLMDMLGQTGGMNSMANELGVSETEARSGTEALLPAIMGGFKKQAQGHPQGEEGFHNMLGQMGGGGLLDNVLSPQPTDVSQGKNVLGQIFGSRDVSHAVAENAAQRSGLQPSMLRKMLPFVAMMAAGHMAKQRGLGGMGGMGGMAVLGGMSGMGRRGGGLGAMLDMDGDGNPLDDIMRMVGRR